MLLRNGALGGGKRDLLEASYSLSSMRERTRKCVSHIMDCVIAIGYSSILILEYHSCSA